MTFTLVRQNGHGHRSYNSEWFTDQYTDLYFYILKITYFCLGPFLWGGWATFELFFSIFVVVDGLAFISAKMFCMCLAALHASHFPTRGTENVFEYLVNADSVWVRTEHIYILAGIVHTGFDVRFFQSFQSFTRYNRWRFTGWNYVIWRLFGRSWESRAQIFSDWWWYFSVRFFNAKLLRKKCSE